MPNIPNVSKIIPPKKRIATIIADHPGKFKLRYLLKIITTKKTKEINENMIPINNEKYKGTREKEVTPLINSL